MGRAVKAFCSDDYQHLTATAAGQVIAVAPMTVFFILLQRNSIKGMAVISSVCLHL